MPQVNIYSYSSRKLLHSIETGHSANIFCTKFVPETSDELVVSGAGDAEVMLRWGEKFYSHDAHAFFVFSNLIRFYSFQVRLFNLSRLKGRGHDESDISPSAVFQCHSRRVKKLAVRAHRTLIVHYSCGDLSMCCNKALVLTLQSYSCFWLTVFGDFYNCCRWK